MRVCVWRKVGGGAVCCTATEIGSFTELCNVLCSEYRSCTSLQLRGVWTFFFFFYCILSSTGRKTSNYLLFFFFLSFFILFFSVVFLLLLVLFSAFLSAVVCKS